MGGSSMNADGVKFAQADADAAAGADFRVNEMRLLLFAVDGIAGAVAQAELAAGAFLRVNFIGDECFADPRRAALVKNMGFVLIPEVADGGQHRVGGSLPQPAQRTAL